MIRTTRWISSIITILCIIAACGTAPDPSPPAQTPTSTPSSTGTPAATAEDVWEELLLATPFPHLLPLPPSTVTPLDGLFARIDHSPPQWWMCYRCADYRPMGGIWRMQFENGIMRIYYEVTDWKSIASYTIEGSRLKIFNDPFCPQDVGAYEWDLHDGILDLTAVEDGCAFDLRRENLIKQSWMVCSTEHLAEGCTQPPDSPPGTTESTAQVTVNAIGGDSHYFTQRPDVFAVANPENVAPPEGIIIRFDDQSIPYGTHRVLWEGGNWMEATTSLPFTSMGVQFWGSAYLGWARVLFDGEEVWRGLTTSLGRKYAYYGGYVEITGFEPGEQHTLRVESLAYDYHPVKVAAFGFGSQPSGK